MKIKLLNLNMLHGGVYYEQMIDFIKQENADILTLQEAYGGTKTQLANHYKTILYLSRLLPNFSHYFSPEVLVKSKEGNIEMGNLIFSKFPIKYQKTIFFDRPYGEYEYGTESGRVDFSEDPKNMQRVTLKTGVLDLNIFNMQGERVTSFNMKRKTNPNYGKSIVDFIFVSKNIKVTDHYIPEADVSDHMPLVCHLEI